MFDKYQIDSSLPEFNKYNLIYGWNASGKTTLSRLLRCFELKKIHNDFPNAEFEIQMEDRVSFNHKALDQVLNIRVFNKDFIDENIFTAEGKVKPIYYIGKEDIEKKNKLEGLKRNKEITENQVKDKEVELKEKRRGKEKFSKEKAKLIKELLRAGKRDKYTDYDKSNFESRMNEIDEPECRILTEDELNRKQKGINQNFKDKISCFEKKELFNKEDIETVNEILEREIISEIIEKLKHNESLNKWVKNGLRLYNHFDKSMCHFCEQPMPEQRIKSLEQHFSESYKNRLFTRICG